MEVKLPHKTRKVDDKVGMLRAEGGMVWYGMAHLPLARVELW